MRQLLFTSEELEQMRREDIQDRCNSLTFADKVCHRRLQKEWSLLTCSTEMRDSDEYTQEYDKARHVGSYHATARQRKKMEAKYDS
jgi:hypothetical protein